MSRKKLSLFLTVFTMAASIAAFQNCTKGFKSQTVSASSSVEPFIDPGAPLSVYAIDESTVTNKEMTVVFKLNKKFESDVDVVWKTADGTAKAGYNFTTTTSTTTIPAGQMSATGKVPGIVSDSVNPIDFTVEIQSASGGAAIGRKIADLHIEVGSSPFKLEDKWYPISMVNAFASPRQGFSTVWTGSKLIVWGGIQPAAVAAQTAFFNTGSIYDPATDSWKAISATNAPQGRAWNAAIWTGTRMIVYGGMAKVSGTLTGLNDGGSYDPVTDTWTPISTVNAPFANAGAGVQTPAVWTGTKMIACCFQSGLGATYDPSTDQWSPISTVNQPVVEQEAGMGALVGNNYVWFGGYNGTGSTLEGGMLNYPTNTWAPVSKTGVRVRSFGLPVSTGTYAIFIGGLGQPGTGDVFNPATNTWQALPPAPGSNASTFNGTHAKAFWTVTGLVAFSPSGYTSGATAAPPPTHYKYDLISRTWTVLSTASSPVADASAIQGVWTGSSFIYISASYDNAAGSTTSNSGGIYK